MNRKLAWLNWASLYELLSSYKEFILAFIKLVKLLHQLLGQNTQPWIRAAGECVCEVVYHISKVLQWVNVDLLANLRMKTRVLSWGIATLFLQHHPDKPLA